MKTEIVCPICNQVINRAHGYMHGGILSIHIHMEHPTEYREIGEVYAAVERIEQKYKIYARDFHNYRIHNYIEKK